MKFNMRDYGDRVAEVSWGTEHSPEAPEKAERGHSENLEENRKRTLARAKRTVVRKILHNRLDHLLTLTYRGAVTDLDKMRADRELFCDRVQRAIPSWKYLGVYEPHPKRKKLEGINAWHSHLAVDGRQNVRLLREIWRGIVGEGNIDVAGPRAHKGDPRLAMARYMGKYLTKAAAEDSDWELNRKAYFHSKNVLDPPVEQIEVEFMGGADAAEMAAILLDSRGGRLNSVWESIGGSRGRVASFDIGGREIPYLQAHLLGEPHPLWAKAAREGFCRIGGQLEDGTCENRGSPIS